MKKLLWNLYSMNIKPFFAKAIIKIKMYFVSPLEYLLDTILMSIDILAFVFTYKYLGMPREFSSFVMIGGILNVYWLHSLWNVSVSTYWEKTRGILQIYMISPSNNLSLFLGSAFGTSISASGVAIVSLIFAKILKFPFHIHNIPLTLTVFFLTVLNIMILGALFSSIFLLWGREGWLWGMLFEEPVYIASGVYYPLKFLPNFIHIFSYLIPMAFGIDALRQIIVNKKIAWLPLELEIFALLSLTFVFFILALIFSKKLYEKARKEGKLTGVEE